MCVLLSGEAPTCNPHKPHLNDGGFEIRKAFTLLIALKNSTAAAKNARADARARAHTHRQKNARRVCYHAVVPWFFASHSRGDCRAPPADAGARLFCERGAREKCASVRVRARAHNTNTKNLQSPAASQRRTEAKSIQRRPAGLGAGAAALAQ
jgi:hypothetical protein